MYSKQLEQAYEVQDLAFEALKTYRADINEGKISKEDARAILQLSTAWKHAQERISFHRRVPSPGALKPRVPKRVAGGPVNLEPEPEPEQPANGAEQPASVPTEPSTV